MWPDVWKIDMENILDNLNLSKKRGKWGQRPSQARAAVKTPSRSPWESSPSRAVLAVLTFQRQDDTGLHRWPASDDQLREDILLVLTCLGSQHLGTRWGSLSEEQEKQLFCFHGPSPCVNFQSVFVVPKA